MMSNPLSFVRDRRRDEDGFTLIELLVVVVILGILIGIAIPVYLNYRKSANDKAAQSDVRNAISTFEVCNSDGGYPTAVSGTGTMTNCASQTLTRTASTTFRYVPDSAATTTAGSVTTYTIYGQATGGTNKVYCYNSGAAGGVKDATGTTLSSATC